MKLHVVDINTSYRPLYARSSSSLLSPVVFAAVSEHESSIKYIKNIHCVQLHLHVHIVTQTSISMLISLISLHIFFFFLYISSPKSVCVGGGSKHYSIFLYVNLKFNKKNCLLKKFPFLLHLPLRCYVPARLSVARDLSCHHHRINIQYKCSGILLKLDAPDL